MKYRWISPEEESVEADRDWNRVEQILKIRGWMSLNRPTSRVLVAEDEDGSLAGFICLQLVPYTGPIWVHPSERGTGVADELAKQMFEFMIQAGARGWMAGAESPHGQRLCEKYNMEKVPYPMYIVVGMEEIKKERVH